jgi:hypothetical protein
MKATIVSLLVALSAPLMAGDAPALNFKKARTVVFLNYFNAYDVNGDEVISETEFQGTVGASNVPVITEYRFLFMADAIVDTAAIAPSGIIKGPLGIDLETYVRYAGGLRVPKPSKWTLFELADDDNDGFLDPEEYALTRNVATPFGALAKSFNKLDKNDDNLISPSEYGLAVKL